MHPICINNAPESKMHNNANPNHQLQSNTPNQIPNVSIGPFNITNNIMHINNNTNNNPKLTQPELESTPHLITNQSQSNGTSSISHFQINHISPSISPTVPISTVTSPSKSTFNFLPTQSPTYKIRPTSTNNIINDKLNNNNDHFISQDLQTDGLAQLTTYELSTAPIIQHHDPTVGEYQNLSSIKILLSTTKFGGLLPNLIYFVCKPTIF